MKDKQLTSTASEETEVEFAEVSSRVSIITREQYRQRKQDNDIPSYVDYNKLRQYAMTYQRSHRLETYVAWQLQQLGLDAVVLPAIADGDTKQKQADILITTAEGRRLALEVKEARYHGCTLGKPNNGSLHEYERLPRRLFIDSVSAWDAKKRACERRGEQLLGAVILCPIGSLSDEDFTVLGCVYCPVSLSDHWLVKETCNRGRYYDAYVCKQRQMRTLEDVNEATQ